MVATNFRASTRKLKFPPIMVRNTKKMNYPPLPASFNNNNNYPAPLPPNVNTRSNKNINNLFDPVYNGNANKYLKTLKNRYKNRNQRLRVLNRALNMNVNTKRNLRSFL